MAPSSRTFTVYDLVSGALVGTANSLTSLSTYLTQDEVAGLAGSVEPNESNLPNLAASAANANQRRNEYKDQAGWCCEVCSGPPPSPPGGGGTEIKIKFKPNPRRIFKDSEIDFEITRKGGLSAGVLTTLALLSFGHAGLVRVCTNMRAHRRKRWEGKL